MQVQVDITGTTPMLMHSVQLVDPDNEFTKAIKVITDKRKKTEDDRREIERLEWYGGLYVEDGRVVMPTANVRKCFINSGKVTRRGTDVSRAFLPTTLHVPLAYEGPRDLEAMRTTAGFVNRAAVGISGKKTMRVRPQFVTWALSLEAVLLENVLDLTDLQRIAEQAGVAEGIGDNRANGYGKFRAEVKAL